MQMNANQLTKIPVEKLSDTLQFLIVENEIPFSDALKQVIDDVDAVCKKLLRDEPAPAQPVLPKWPSDEVERDALRYRFLRDKDFFGDEDEPGLVGWEGLVELGYNEFDAAVDARISHPDIDYVKLDTALRKHIPAQPVSEPNWVSVADRLPSEFGRYLCYVEEQNDLGKSHYQWNCSWNGDVFSDSSLTGRVTHWMPLPAAPAQESE